MKKLETFSDMKKDESKLSKEVVHDEHYMDMVKKYPQLQDHSFKKGTPVHGVFHRIDTADHPPSKAKRRPIIANKAKAEEGKRLWR